MSHLDKKILTDLVNNPKIKASKGSIQSIISRIRANNPGLTINAAASIYAKRKGVTIMRRLSPEDRQSLQAIQQTPQIPIQKKSNIKIKVKHITHSFDNQFIKDAYQNADIYPYAYILENSLRNLILNTFNSEKDWWDTKATKDAKNHAKMIQEAEKEHDWLLKRGNHPIYYIGLNDLFGIISRNYPIHFKKIFKDLNMLKTWINECVPIRNLLAHNVKINKDERDNLRIRTKYICRQIKNNSKGLKA